MSLTTDLRDALDDIDGWPTKDSVIDAVTVVIDESDLHGPEDCERSESERQVSMLAEAVRILHQQAHNGPKDTLAAENCYSEPCTTVAAILAAAEATALHAFPAGSRVA